MPAVSIMLVQSRRPIVFHQSRSATDPHLTNLFVSSRITSEPPRLPPDAGAVLSITSRNTPAFQRPVTRTNVAEPELRPAFPGAVLQIHAPYGASPLPAHPVLPHSESSPFAGWVYSAPLRTGENRPSGILQPSFARAGEIATPIQPIASHGTPARFAATATSRTARDDSTAAAGSVLARSALPTPAQIPPRLPRFVRAGEADRADGQVWCSHGMVSESGATAPPSLARAAEAVAPIIQPVTSHGSPPRDAVTRPAVVRDSSWLAAGGTIIARTLPGSLPLRSQTVFVRDSAGRVEDARIIHSHGIAAPPVKPVSPFPYAGIVSAGAFYGGELQQPIIYSAIAPPGVTPDIGVIVLIDRGIGSPNLTILCGTDCECD